MAAMMICFRLFQKIPKGIWIFNRFFKAKQIEIKQKNMIQRKVFFIKWWELPFGGDISEVKPVLFNHVMTSFKNWFTLYVILCVHGTEYYIRTQIHGRTPLLSLFPLQIWLKFKMYPNHILHFSMLLKIYQKKSL